MVWVGIPHIGTQDWDSLGMPPCTREPALDSEAALGHLTVALFDRNVVRWRRQKGHGLEHPVSALESFIRFRV